MADNDKKRAEQADEAAERNRARQAEENTRPLGEAPKAGFPAPDVPLAGVPETPPGQPGVNPASAAVPSTDNVKTESSPNLETSGPTAANVGADAAAIRGVDVEQHEQEGVLPADQRTPDPSAPQTQGGDENPDKR